jgi:phosphate transport system substrate-binding protein
VKKILAVVLMLSVLAGTAACGKKPPAFTPDTYPRVDGSTVTLPLSIDLAAILLGISREDAQDFIVHNKTHPAYLNLLEGNADIILVTEPSGEELALAESMGIELEIVPVVRDAFVFVLNKKNPVDSLTETQIREIYQGKITNWKEVGGEDKEIIAYQRPKNSGSQTLMENLVMQGLTMAEPPMEHIPAGMGDLIERVAGFDNSDQALGYSVYYYANSMYIRESMKFLAVNGILPLRETIAAKTYPFTISYYAVLRKSEPKDSAARKYLNYILSDNGQKLAVSSGYVPLR